MVEPKPLNVPYSVTGTLFNWYKEKMKKDDLWEAIP